MACCDHNRPRSYSELRVLELYSGIGGMHYAVQELQVPVSIIAAVDINTTANKVYRHNFPSTSLWQRNIQSLTVDEVGKLCPDIITMSPPCQPFTRLGLKNDCSDPRTSSFLCVLDVIANLQKKPSYIFLENVKGFEESEARKALINTLNKSGYVYQEFLINPLQLGIPNSRLRYYLLAKLKPLQFCFAHRHEILERVPDFEVEGCRHYHITRPISSTCSNQLSLYLENLDEEMEAKYLLPEKVLSKYAMILDIVDKNSCRTCCFTKGYGHFIEGTGSVLHTNLNKTISEVYSSISGKSDQERVEQLRGLKMRYFTPREIANLMHFPPEFSFPDDVSRKQQYQLLGNSVNVKVVALLLSYLLPNRCADNTCTCK